MAGAACLSPLRSAGEPEHLLPEAGAEQVVEAPRAAESGAIGEEAAESQHPPEGSGVRVALAPALDPRTRCFVEAYPSFFASAELDPVSGDTVLVAHDGRAFPWHDGVARERLEDLLAAPSLADTLHYPYLPGGEAAPPPADHDPGRVRNEPLLRALYGETERQARERMTRVHWEPSGDALRFSSSHGAADALQRVSDDLVAELTNVELATVSETAGTFNWRLISGTNRMSAHSFAIAIDINTEYSDYWRWSRRRDGSFEYRNRIPISVVRIFERHGFIWGGRWYHFDTMHFEYRPELLHPACVASSPVSPGEPQGFAQE